MMQDALEAEEFERRDNSGMDVLEYIKSRIEEGEPPFNEGWEELTSLMHEYDMLGLKFHAAMAATGKIVTDSSGLKGLRDKILSTKPINVNPENMPSFVRKAMEISLVNKKSKDRRILAKVILNKIPVKERRIKLKDGNIAEITSVGIFELLAHSPADREIFQKTIMRALNSASIIKDGEEYYSENKNGINYKNIAIRMAEEEALALITLKEARDGTYRLHSSNYATKQNTSGTKASGFNEAPSNYATGVNTRIIAQGLLESQWETEEDFQNFLRPRAKLSAKRTISGTEDIPQHKQIVKFHAELANRPFFEEESKKTTFNGDGAGMVESSSGTSNSRPGSALSHSIPKHGEVANIIPKSGNHVKARIQKFDNKDYSIATKGKPIGAIIASLRKTLDLNPRGAYGSSYGIYKTPRGNVAFRLSGHAANGENFARDNADKNTSVVIEMFDWKGAETTIPYEEFVYPKDVFDKNRDKVVAAIMHGFKKMLDTGNFEDESGLAIQFSNGKIKNAKLSAGRRVVTKEMDQEYLDAVKSGDTAKALELVRDVAEKNGYTDDTSYRTRHHAPNAEYGATLDDVTSMFGTHEREALLRMGYGRSSAREAVDQIMNAKGNPDAEITVYRAVPKTVKDVNIRRGDWVSLSEEYAHEHGESVINGKYKIIKAKVPAKYVYTNGDMLEEAGFDDSQEYVYKNTKNGTKIFGITYDDNGELIPLSKRFKERNPDARFQFAKAEKPIVNKSRFIAGRARVADDAGVGEQTPGAMAASRELAETMSAPISNIGDMRKISLPIPMLELLRKKLTGDVMPSHIASKLPGGKYAGKTKAGRIYIEADIFGNVDKTDSAQLKEQLKANGNFFRHEDPEWRLGKTKYEIEEEQKRSEDQLATEILKLGEFRTMGKVHGGSSAARKVFADQVARIILDMPEAMPGVLGKMQKIGKSLRQELKRTFSAESEAGATEIRNEAGSFLDWAYSREASGNADMGELAADMFGAWLVMPAEMEARAPRWANSIEAIIAGNDQLRAAFKEVSTITSTDQGSDYLMQRIRQQISRQTEETLKKLNWEARQPISTGSKMGDFKEQLLVGFHDKFAPVYLRIDEKAKNYLSAQNEALKKATDPNVKAALKAEIERFEGDLATKMHRLELSRTAYERGSYNEGRRYFTLMALLEDKASVKWGLSQEDRSVYLQLKRVIETQGRAASFGMTPQNAQIALNKMAARLGEGKFAKLEEYAREFHKIHESEILDDPRIERALGKAFVDYCRTQTNYVTTKRTFSIEEMAAIDVARKEAKKSGVAGNDDVVAQMYAYAGAKGAGSVVGENAWLGKLKGSMAATQEVRSATWEKADPLMQFGRRNQMILDLRDALTAANVEGVRDLVRSEGSQYPSDAHGRYGHINYMENGEKRVLIVPKQISEAFKLDPDNAQWITKANGLVRSLLIDYNVAYWGQNVRRNQDSVEKNMPGMRETYLKSALRAFAPGAGVYADLALQALVRKMPIMGHLFSEHTIFAHIPKAERYAKIIENPSGWQQDLWKAERAGDTAKVDRMHEDFAGVMEMMKGNFLVPAKAAYKGGETDGFAFDAMNKKGLKTLEQIHEEEMKRTPLRKFVDKINIFKMNQAQQEHEDILAKTIAYLHDRANYSLERSVEESGLVVKKNVSIAEGERSGTLKRPVQQFMAQFFNMVEKGVVRHWAAIKDRPGEMLIKDGKVWIGRLIGQMFAGGIMMNYMIKDAGDEDKAKEKYGKLFEYANFFHRAYQNCSNYIKSNYNILPVWNSSDGMTSIILGGGLTDEDKLITPSADLVAQMMAHKAGIGPRPEFGKAIADSTFKAVTPDLQMATPFVNLIRATVEATLIDNPTDYFRGAPMYDQKLWDARNEGWEMRGKFAAAVGARLWNDFGGRAVWAADVNGVDNGRGTAPEELAAALKWIPVLSPALARLVKIQVGSPEKKAEAITDEKKRKQNIIGICAEELLKRSGIDTGLHESNFEEFTGLLEKWEKIYQLGAEEIGKIQEKYYNAWIQRKCRSAYDQVELSKLFEEGKKQGLSDTQIWIMLGER